MRDSRTRNRKNKSISRKGEESFLQKKDAGENEVKENSKYNADKMKKTKDIMMNKFKPVVKKKLKKGARKASLNISKCIFFFFK